MIKMGKGSDRRPMDKTHCTPEEFRNRWDQIFGPSGLDKKKLDKTMGTTKKNITSKEEEVCPGNCLDSSLSQS